MKLDSKPLLSAQHAMKTRDGDLSYGRAGSHKMNDNAQNTSDNSQAETESPVNNEAYCVSHVTGKEKEFPWKNKTSKYQSRGELVLISFDYK